PYAHCSKRLVCDVAGVHRGSHPEPSAPYHRLDGVNLCRTGERADLKERTISGDRIHHVQLIYSFSRPDYAGARLDEPGRIWYFPIVPSRSCYREAVRIEFFIENSGGWTIQVRLKIVGLDLAIDEEIAIGGSRIHSDERRLSGRVEGAAVDVAVD